MKKAKSIYKVNEETLKYINNELGKQRIVPQEEINDQFKKVADYFISTNVPAYMRTNKTIKSNNLSLNLVLYDFLVKYMKGEIRYSYKKTKTSETLDLRIGDEWKNIGKAVWEERK